MITTNFYILVLSTIKSWIYVVLPRELFNLLKSFLENDAIYVIPPKFTLDCYQVILVTSKIMKIKLIFEIMREVGLKAIYLTWQNESILANHLPYAAKQIIQKQCLAFRGFQVEDFYGQT